MNKFYTIFCFILSLCCVNAQAQLLQRGNTSSDRQIPSTVGSLTDAQSITPADDLAPDMLPMGDKPQAQGRRSAPSAEPDFTFEFKGDNIVYDSRRIFDDKNNSLYIVNVSNPSKSYTYCNEVQFVFYGETVPNGSYYTNVMTTAYPGTYNAAYPTLNVTCSAGYKGYTYTSNKFALGKQQAITCYGSDYYFTPAAYTYFLFGSGETMFNNFVANSCSIKVAKGKKGCLYLLADLVVNNSAQNTVRIIIGEPKPENYVEVTLTEDLICNDNTSSEAAVRYLQCSGQGIGDDNKTYNVALRVNATNPTGTFTEADINNDFSYIEVDGTTLSITSASVNTTKVTDQVTKLEATLIASNGKTYYVTSQFTLCQTSAGLPSIELFSFSADSVHSELVTINSWSSTPRTFVYICAKNKSSKRYFQLLFWPQNSSKYRMYNGHYAPVPGTYSVANYPTLNSSSKWTYSGGINTFVGVDLDRTFVYGSLVGSMFDTENITNITDIATGYYVVVEEGREGNFYIELRQNGTNRLTMTIGEPALTSTYTLSQFTNGEGSVEISPNDCSYAVGTNVTLTPTAEDGYYFANWSGADGSSVIDNGDGTYNISITNRNMVVTANFSNIYQLNWDIAGGTKETPGSEDGEYEAGSAITAPTVTKDGYEFTGWTPAFTGTMPAYNITYTATWTKNAYTITWQTDGDALEGDYTKGEVTIDSNITAPQTPTRQGYTFAGWYPSVAASMPENDLVYSATWTAPATQTHICIDPEGYTNEGGADWYIDGWDEHNDKYESYEYVTRDTIYRDTLRSADNSFDSIYYSLKLTYSTMYKQYNRLGTPANGSTTTKVDFRVDLGTFYLNDESDSYTNDGQAFTLANLEGKNDSTFSLKIASGTALHGCDSVVKFTLTQSPLLTWNATGGNLTDGDYTNGRTKPTTAIVAPADPTRNGYTFNGWNTAADGTGNPYTADDVMPTTDLTYYTQWTANTYTITYNELNGATNANPTTYTIETDDITFVSPGERDGYTFCGWKNEAGETVTGIPTGSTGDTIIIAQWTLNTYKLTFYGEGLTNGVEQTTLVPGTAITAPTLPERSDNNGTYVFVGWYSDKAQTVITDFAGMTMPEEDITFRATWTLTSYDNKCIDSEGNDYDATSIMMFTERWQLEGTDIFFDDHNSNYEDYDYVADYIADVNPTTPLAADFTDTYIFTDALTATDGNGLQFDSIVYRLEMTYSRFFNSHKPNNFAPESSRMDERIDLGTFYLNDESDSYSNDGQIFTLANLEGKNDSTFSLKIASGTALHGCDSVVKFTLTQSPLLTWNATGGNLTDGDYTNGRTKPTTAIVAPADPTRNGYTFNGWNTTEDGTGNPYTADDIMPTTDLTYYAQWTANTYTITYNELNGATNSNPTTYNIESDDITFVSPGERDGYTFCGWKNEAGETVTGIPTGSTGDTIIIAQWTLNTYKLTFYGEGLTNGVEQTTLVPGTAITAPTLPEKIGTDAAGNEFTYTFNGWYPTLTEGAVMPENDVTYYATWSAPTVYENTCVDSDGEQEYEDYYWEIPGWDEHNDNYDPANGFVFDRVDRVYTDIMRSGDYSFDSITYTLSMTYTRMYKRYMRFGMTGGTWVDDRTDLGTIYLNDESDKVTIDNQDYTLADIASAGTDGYIEKYITGGTVGFGCDSVVKFTLTQSPLLTWDTDGGNLTDGDYTDGRTKPGTAITNPADPTKDGYEFEGWNKAADGTGDNYSTDDVMPTSDLTYTAQWNAIEYTITYDNLYGTTHTNQTTYTIETADIVLIAPSERDGYVFTCWTDESGTTVTTIATGTTGNITLTANWEEALPQDVLLYDNWSEEEYAELFDKYRGKVINVIFKRTFKANEWTTITLPFAIDFEDYPDFDGNIFELSNATTDETDGFVLYFSPVDGIETACVPYLFRPTTNIVEPRFENVQFESFDKMVVLCSSGDVEFHSTTYLDRITNRTSLYINNNRLYYANQTTGTRMRAFRGYFELLHPEKMEYVQPRFRLPGMAEPIEITEGTEDADETTDTAIKYIQDDRLVIELNGIRYNAIGNKIR